MAQNIIFSANNNEEVLVLPVIPRFELNNPQDNEQFKTINSGTLNLIGMEGLRSFELQSIFPCNPYPWIRPGASANGWDYVDFFGKWRKAKVPMRVIGSKEDGTEWFNFPCTVDSFVYTERPSKDIAYTLSVTEYPFVKK